jgi:hypothetical protein
MEPVEVARAHYRPERITTLFVGESAPASGAFFYHGDSAMLRYMQRAAEAALGVGSGVFLDRFKAWGWFLDDLVLTPVNNLTQAERIAKCRAAQSSLAERIADHRPLAIVNLLLSINEMVEAAAIAAGSSAALYAVPFPGMGQQRRFLDAMGRIIPMLPKIGR